MTMEQYDCALQTLEDFAYGLTDCQELWRSSLDQLQFTASEMRIEDEALPFMERLAADLRELEEIMHEFRVLVSKYDKERWDWFNNHSELNRAGG